MPPSDREMGEMSATLEAHGQRLKAIESKLDRIVSQFDNAKGGVRMLFIIGSTIAAFAAAVVELIHSLRH